MRAADERPSRPQYPRALAHRRDSPGIELKRAVPEQHERFEPSVVLIEDKAPGTQLIQELIAEGLHAVTRYPQSDKVMRLHAQTAMIENGFGHLPKQAPWLAPYLAELTPFCVMISVLQLNEEPFSS
jgi:predicted phage terminase large subunit-like protein